MKKTPTDDEIKVMPPAELLKKACSIIYNFNAEAPDARVQFDTLFKIQQRIRSGALETADMQMLNNAQILANESNYLLTVLQTHLMRTAPRLFVEPGADGNKWLK